jgi:hypothetical protein
VLDGTQPLFMNPGAPIAAADLSLINGGTIAAGLADGSDALTPTTDILGGTRDGSPDAGAYEYLAGPAPFAFTGFLEADVLTTYTSMPVSVTGLAGAGAIAVTGDASALYSVNSTTLFTASPGTVINGDVVRARVTTGSDGATAYDAVVTINGVAAAYTVVTQL